MEQNLKDIYVIWSSPSKNITTVKKKARMLHLEWSTPKIKSHIT